MSHVLFLLNNSIAQRWAVNSLQHTQHKNTSAASRTQWCREVMCGMGYVSRHHMCEKRHKVGAFVSCQSYCHNGPNAATAESSTLCKLQHTSMQPRLKCMEATFLQQTMPVPPSSTTAMNFHTIYIVALTEACGELSRLET